MESISELKSSLAGVLNAFLIKERKLVWSDTKVSVQDLNSLYYLADVIRERRDLKRITIGAAKTLFIFLHEDYFLGVITIPTINVPMLALYVNKVLQNVDKVAQETVGIKVEVREPNLFDKQNPMLPPHILQSLGIGKKGEIVIKTEDKKTFTAVVEEINDKKWDTYDVIMMHTAVRQRLGVTIGSYVYVEKRA